MAARSTAIIRRRATGTKSRNGDAQKAVGDANTAAKHEVNAAAEKANKEL
jgi:hypothetical protein